LEDAISGEKHYIRSATIGNSVEAPTYLDYAETREFTLVFPPIGKMRKFHLKEGMQGLKWWFMDVDLTYKPNIKYTQLKAFSDSIGQEIRVHIADENYQEAMLQLKYQINKSPLNTILYNLAGITSFLQKKKDDAEQYFIKAFALDSTDINNLLDLYTLYLDKGNYLKALNFIDKAIDIAPNFPDLNLYKGDILDQLLQYKDAISYFEKYLKSDRSDKEYALLRIAVCKMKLGDKIACEDLIKYEKYYSYLKDSEVNAIKVFIKENCVK
jgi:tetratricopeptide (TPR) repeat protein